MTEREKMIAGMMPIALGLGEGGEQTAPLGRAVVGGLFAATLTTLLVLPGVFALVMGQSLRPVAHRVDLDDPESCELRRGDGLDAVSKTQWHRRLAGANRPHRRDAGATTTVLKLRLRRINFIM